MYHFHSLLDTEERLLVFHLLSTWYALTCFRSSRLGHKFKLVQDVLEPSCKGFGVVVEKQLKVVSHGVNSFVVTYHDL